MNTGGGMRRLGAAAVLGLATVSPVAALETGSAPPPSLTAEPPVSGESRLGLALSPYFRAGPLLSRPADGDLPTRPGVRADDRLRLGGFLEYRQGAYGVDAEITGGDGVAADVGASYGGEAPGLGMPYRVRLGAGFSDGDAGSSYFSLNPLRPGAGFGEAEAAGRDLNLTLSLRFSLRPDIEVGGIAGASRSLGELGAIADDSQFLFGAGIGLRF